MPTYTYSCENCGQLEIKQSIHEKTLLVCPECDSIAFAKTYVPAGIQFKGSGFYSTDSRGK